MANINRAATPNVALSNSLSFYFMVSLFLLIITSSKARKLTEASDPASVSRIEV
jgi:hypothetical protein